MMQWQGIVFDGVNGPFFGHRGEIFALSGTAMLTVEGTVLVPVATCAQEAGTWSWLYPTADGVWASHHPAEDGAASFVKFHDIYRTGRDFPTLPDVLPCDMAQTIPGCLLGEDDDEDGPHLVLHELASGARHRKPGKYRKLRATTDTIYAYEKLRGIVCTDLQLNERWCHPLDSPDAYLMLMQPEGDMLIVYNDMKVWALRQASGEIAWEVPLKKYKTRLNTQDGKLYLGDETDMLVIDCQSGAILLQEPAGLSGIGLSGSATPGFALQAAPHALVALDREEREIRIHGADGKRLLTSLNLREIGYLVDETFCATVEDKVVVKISSSSGEGMLVLQPAEPGAPAFVRGDPPRVRVLAVPGLAMPHCQRIHILETEPWRAGRAIAHAVQELHDLTGHMGIYMDAAVAADIQHDGLIEVVVDADRFDDDALRAFDDVLAGIRETFATRKALNGTRKVKISLERVALPVSQWQKEGDVLDLGEIRRTCTLGVDLVAPDAMMTREQQALALAALQADPRLASAGLRAASTLAQGLECFHLHATMVGRDIVSIRPFDEAPAEMHEVMAVLAPYVRAGHELTIREINPEGPDDIVTVFRFDGTQCDMTQLEEKPARRKTAGRRK